MMNIFFAFGMAFALMPLIFCQVYFYTKRKIKLSDAKGVLIFINNIMFQSSLLENLSALFFLISCVMGLALSWSMGEPRENIFSYSIGLLGVVSLFWHCRMFYVQKSTSYEPDFLNELFFRYEVSRFVIFIWISRLCYLTSFFMFFLL